MLSFFKCRKSKQPVSMKPIKASYSDSIGVIGLSAPTDDSTPIPLRGKISLSNTEPTRSSIKKSSVDSRGKKPSVTWDDEGYDGAIDLTRRNSSSSRKLSDKSKTHITNDERLYITEGVGSGRKSSSSTNSKTSKSSSKGDDVIVYGSEKVNKLPKGKVEPMKTNPKLESVKELYNENREKENSSGEMDRLSSKRLEKGINDCTLTSEDSYGRERYFTRDKKSYPSIFKTVESHEVTTDGKKKSSKKSGFFSSSLIDNCFPMYSTVRMSKTDNECDLNMSENFMNAKNKILHREHSAGTGLFNNRLTSFGYDKGYLDGRGPGCASMATNPEKNGCVIRKRRDLGYQRTISKGDKFCVNSGLIDGSDDSSIIYRLSRGISGLQTSTYVLPERPFLKRNSLDYTRDSKLYYIKVKAEHERRERERQMKEKNGQGYYNEDGEFVDIVPPPYLTKDSSCEEFVKPKSFWDKCCPR